jgi:hypothetical protein
MSAASQALCRNRVFRWVGCCRFVDVTVRFTYQATEGMHSAIIQASKPPIHCSSLRSCSTRFMWRFTSAGRSSFATSVGGHDHSVRSAYRERGEPRPVAVKGHGNVTTLDARRACECVGCAACDTKVRVRAEISVPNPAPGLRDGTNVFRLLSDITVWSLSRGRVRARGSSRVRSGQCCRTLECGQHDIWFRRRRNGAMRRGDCGSAATTPLRI